MRRIDVLGIGIGFFAAGGVLYVILRIAGLNSLDAGLWAQAGLVLGIVLWLLSYLLRVVTKNMTYNQQLQDYEDAVLQKRLDEMSPEELAQLQAKLDQEQSSHEADSENAQNAQASTTTESSAAPSDS